MVLSTADTAAPDPTTANAASATEPSPEGLERVIRDLGILNHHTVSLFKPLVDLSPETVAVAENHRALLDS